MHKLLIKAKFDYKITILLTCNYKVLKGNLDPQQNQIKENNIQTNKVFISRY